MPWFFCCKLLHFVVISVDSCWKSLKTVDFLLSLLKRLIIIYLCCLIAVYLPLIVVYLPLDKYFSTISAVLLFFTRHKRYCNLNIWPPKNIRDWIFFVDFNCLIISVLLVNFKIILRIRTLNTSFFLLHFDTTHLLSLMAYFNPEP